MSDVYFYDPNGVVIDMITKIIKSANTPDYTSTPNVLINPNIDGVSGVPQKYWKRSENAVSEMVQGEKDAVDQELADKMKAQQTDTIKGFLFPVAPTIQYTIDVTGLQVTINVTDLISNDITNIIADPTDTKYVLFSLVYDKTSDVIFLVAREKTTQLYAELYENEYLVQHLKEYSVAANGSNLVDTGEY